MSALRAAGTATLVLGVVAASIAFMGATFLLCVWLVGKDWGPLVAIAVLVWLFIVACVLDADR